MKKSKGNMHGRFHNVGAWMNIVEAKGGKLKL
jgi:hypothetical protein